MLYLVWKTVGRREGSGYRGEIPDDTLASPEPCGMCLVVAHLSRASIALRYAVLKPCCSCVPAGLRSPAASHSCF
ncbi:hypothetical protein AAFF_G00009880 [Aldrovandia affinis]|uniref:Uncharacterized protein n=1 Tax=Aldrovandia affinis TaxID=143900 RepID=A0AAD7S740_9TELE|nr:hypothetical protein AAFF_G00009880 [Aldrovandia affinis]